MLYFDNDPFKIMAKLACWNISVATWYISIGNTMLCGVKRNSVIIIINIILLISVDDSNMH